MYQSWSMWKYIHIDTYIYIYLRPRLEKDHEYYMWILFFYKCRSRNLTNKLTNVIWSGHLIVELKCFINSRCLISILDWLTCAPSYIPLFTHALKKRTWKSNAWACILTRRIRLNLPQSCIAYNLNEKQKERKKNTRAWFFKRQCSCFIFQPKNLPVKMKNFF